MGDLALVVAGSSGAAGTIETTFALKNSSGASCTLFGYPGTQLLGASGDPVPTNTVRGGTYGFTNFAPSRVTLGAGQSAYFNTGYSDVPSGAQATCSMSARIEVTPPNDYTQLVTAFQATVCGGGTLVVSPVFGPGSPQTQTTAPAQALKPARTPDPGGPAT